MTQGQTERMIAALERIAAALEDISRDSDLLSDCVAGGIDGEVSSFTISAEDLTTEQPD